MKAFVTGAAGFIGSNVVDRLLEQGHSVTGIDNLSSGHPKFLEGARTSPRFRFIKADLMSKKTLERIVPRETNWVFHFAANADVRHGLKHPYRDLEQNTLATFNLLEAMRKLRVRNIVFSSTGSIYGESTMFPTPEDAPFPIQTSLYGASKLAAEGLISAYVEGFQFKALIFRFVSILGERYSHGHVFDFMKLLKRNPKVLPVLGNGKQTKSYLYIQDCVDAIFRAIKSRWPKPIQIINLGTHEHVTVNESIDVICEELGVAPRRRYAGGDRGWIGDSPFIFLDCRKMLRTGWKPRVNIRDAVRRTVNYLQSNPWLLSARN